jgi:ribosome modulation factor
MGHNYSPFLRSDLKQAFDRGFKDYFEDKSKLNPFVNEDEKEAWFDGQVKAATGDDITMQRAIRAN